MIWSIVEKREMENCGTNMVFRHYREALGKENVRLAVVNSDDPLDFVKEGDIVLCRFFDRILSETLKAKNIVNTAEDFYAYACVSDKEAMAISLSRHGIRVPRQYDSLIFQDGHEYFVKPRFGSDSFGITEKSVCRSSQEIENCIEYLEKDLKMESVIEDFIEGKDCTVACWKNGSSIFACGIEVECDNNDGIQTRECKVGFNEYCSALHDKELEETAKDVFRLLRLKHYARIDFRKGNDRLYYLIDVNLLPGLGPLDHFAKCLLLAKNISYIDAIKEVINTASL